VPKFLIERHIPGIHTWGPDEMRAIVRKSNDVIGEIGTQLQWIHSYVLNDKLYCVYISPDEGLLREHAKLGGFPCNNVTRIVDIIDPARAEG
jgi:hypothetical protein